MSRNVAVRPRIMQKDDRKTRTSNADRLREVLDIRGALWTRRTTIFLLFAAAYFISQFLRSANAVIAPDLMAEFSLGAGGLGLITSLFFATFALAQIPLGIGLDRWGPRWLTSGLMALGVVGSLLFALAPTVGVLALGRALLGLGMAGILMGGLKMLSQWYSTERFATMTGMLIGLGALGGLVSATPLAWLNGVIGWRAVFLCVAALIAVTALAIALWTRNTPPGATPPSSNQTRGRLPAIGRDLRLWRIALYMALLGALGAFRNLWAGPYLFDMLGMDSLAAGNLLLLIGVGSIVGFLASGWLADRLGMTRVGLAFGLLSIVCLPALALFPSLLAVGLVYGLIGLAGGIGVLLVAHARRLFPANVTGQVLARVNFAGFAGTFLLQWAMGLGIGLFPTDAAGHYPPSSYATVLLLTAGGILIAFVWYAPLLYARGKA